MQPIISIGVAIYNVKTYLPACLDSILAQQSEEIEILLVDDCSSDGSAALCDAYAEKDGRVRVIHFPENQGICEVRNTIIRESRGQWIYFVDGDDLLPEWFADTALALRDDPHDVVFFDYAGYWKDRPQQVPPSSEEIIELTPETIDSYCISCVSGAPCQPEDERIRRVLCTSVWAKTYRRAFLAEHNLLFPDRQKKSQDVIFNTLVFHYCRSACYRPKVMYYYRTNEGSVCNRYNPDYIPVMNSLMQHNLTHIKAFYPGREDIMDAFYRYRVVGIVLDYMRLDLFHKDNPKNRKQRKQEFLDFLDSHPYSDAMSHLDLNLYWLERQLLLKCAQNRRFSFLSFIHKKPWTLKLYGGIMNRINRCKKTFHREGGR